VLASARIAEVRWLLAPVVLQGRLVRLEPGGMEPERPQVRGHHEPLPARSP
jgi:hypothetical protein